MSKLADIDTAGKLRVVTEMVQAQDIGVLGGNDVGHLGGLSLSSRKLTEVAKIGDTYSEVLSGRALAQYLMDIVMVKTGVGRSVPLGAKEKGTQVGAQATGGETHLSRIIAPGDRETKFGSKLSPIWPGQTGDLLAKYARLSGENLGELQMLLFTFNHRDVVLCPVGVRECCSVITKKHGEQRGYVKAIKWQTDKNTGNVECQVIFDTYALPETLGVEEYFKKFTPIRFDLSGTSRKKSGVDLVSVTPQGVVRPIEIGQTLSSSLIVDNCYVYYRYNGTTKVVGIWESKRIRWGMDEAKRDRLVQSRQSLDSFDMVDKSALYYPCYAMLKDSIPYLSQIRHLIAPYLSIKTNYVSAI